MDRKEEIKKRIQEARKRQMFTVDEYVGGIVKGDRMILAKAITLIESYKEEHQTIAKEIIDKCLQIKSQSLRIGITGTPGVGKSTFIESLGMHVLRKGKKIAVLAIDPTSQMSHGSILGDKTRMEELSHQENAFIRPSAAGTSLGGVARKTREVMILCEAAGYDTIFIETVGVGQSEVAVHSMTDFFLLLLLPGGGDELQGIKRGIVEMADAIVVNKSDINPVLAKQSKKAYRNAVHLFPQKESKWVVKTLMCSALQNEGIDAVWQTILNYQDLTIQNDYFHQKRQQQSDYWFKQALQQGLEQLIKNHPQISQEMKLLKQQIFQGKMSPFAAADKIISLLK